MDQEQAKEFMRVLPADPLPTQTFFSSEPFGELNQRV
jgi:hypothetical protein